MSLKTTTRVWEHAPYDGMKLLILLALADNADDEGLAWPNQTTIARKARCSVETVRRATKQLVEAGAIEIVAEATPRKSKRYILTPQVLGSDFRPHAAEGADPTGERGQTPPLRGVRPLPGEGGTVIETVKETTKETRTIPADDRFEEFWHAYALPKGKAEARKAWAKAIKDTDPQVIISAAREYVLWLDTQDDPPQQKYAQGWLNGRRWEDEIRPQRTKKSNVTRLIDLFAAEEQKGIEG